MRKGTIKVVFNIWGNHACFIGTKRVKTFGAAFDAQYWLDAQYATGLYNLSKHSYMQITPPVK